jgi:hypothetical protein
MLKAGNVKIDDIAEVVGIGTIAFRKHYAKEIEPYLDTRDGRPEHEPTDKDRRVVSMMSVWADQEQVSKAIGISPATLRKYYAKELEVGKLAACNEVVKTNYLRAIGGPQKEWQKASDTAAIWFMKVFMGLKEGPLEVTTPEGRPLQVEGIGSLDAIASRIAEYRERRRSQDDPGVIDGTATSGPPMEVGLLGSPGAENSAGRLDGMAGPGWARVGEDENRSGDRTIDGVRADAAPGD